MFKTIFLVLVATMGQVMGQERPIQIVVEEIPNRLALYAINENEVALDVKLTVSGTNFRQSKAKPRFVRVPATSKVHMQTLVLMRGKKPNYSYEVEVNDSLSNRALVREATKIKIRPAKPIIVYVPANCNVCDSILMPLEQGIYVYKSHKLQENPKMAEQLQRSLGSGTPLDSLTTPILNLGGRLYTTIENYDTLLEALRKN